VTAGILAFRHGNTFGPGDPVVRLGRNEDIPLVESGMAQAHAAADALAAAGIRPVRIATSPLMRARQFAGILAERLGGPPPSVDVRLNELDYGHWSGLTDAAIAERFGAPALDAWNRFGVWPTDAGFGEDADAVKARCASFGADATDGIVVAVSSAGTLRYLLAALDADAYARACRDGRLKFGTGAAARFVRAAGTWRCTAWNVPPAALAGSLAD
jgi:broad specificity phosphatase PhoE